MKRHVILFVALASFISGYGQTVLWNGENDEIGGNGKWWADGQPMVVANPEQGGINTSERCMKFTMTDGQKVVKVPFREWTTPNLNGRRRFSMMVKKAQNENMMIEISDPTNGDNGYWQKVAAWYGGNGEWQKVVFDFSTNSINDFPGIMTITAQTGNVETAQEVYIDNIVIEDLPTVNGLLLETIADGSLTGNIKLEGAWMRGDCQNANGAWAKVEYNDFEKLASKLSVYATSIDCRSATLKDAYNAYGNVNPNILVYAPYVFGGDNVVVDGTTSMLRLDEAYKFEAPEGFEADSVIVRRSLKSGLVTTVLPFSTTAAELGARAVNVLKKVNEVGEKATLVLEEATEAPANVPCWADITDGQDSQAFVHKAIVATPSALESGKMVGLYMPTKATGSWQVEEGRLKKGLDNAVLNSFQAYIVASLGISEMIFGETTGIRVAKAAGMSENGAYTLQGVRLDTRPTAKGIYIIGGKKVVIR